MSMNRTWAISKVRLSDSGSEDAGWVGVEVELATLD